MDSLISNYPSRGEVEKCGVTETSVTGTYPHVSEDDMVADDIGTSGRFVEEPEFAAMVAVLFLPKASGSTLNLSTRRASCVTWAARACAAALEW
jgi:hypothetical protein